MGDVVGWKFELERTPRARAFGLVVCWTFFFHGKVILCLLRSVTVGCVRLLLNGGGEGVKIALS